jgi:anti-sigma factor RsiW
MSEGCEPHRLLLQAELDDELDAGRAAGLAAHVAGCADCAALRDRLLALQARARAELPFHAAPPALRARIAAQLAACAANPLAPAPRLGWRRRGALGFGLGAAMAAGLALAVLPYGAAPDPTREVLASHIRALQPGHLVDVPSSDRHTVKPWFDGKLDYAVPVRDLAGAGFPLIGGRLDYLGGRPVAALAYRRAQHVVEVYVWRAAGPPTPPRLRQEAGYALIAWAEEGMEFHAVSDIPAAELTGFVERFRAAR